MHFEGLISKHTKLKPGSYTLLGHRNSLGQTLNDRNAALHDRQRLGTLRARQSSASREIRASRTATTARGVVGLLLVAEPLRGGQRRSRRDVPRSKLMHTRPSAGHTAKKRAAKDLQPADDMSCMDGGRKGTRGGPVHSGAGGQDEARLPDLLLLRRGDDVGDRASRRGLAAHLASPVGRTRRSVHSGCALAAAHPERRS